MTYLPYTPDVRPPPADPTYRPPSRAARWVVGTALYLLMVALWTWWMTIPPKLEPPLAVIPLPDGTELRLVHVAHGASFPADSKQTFDGRVHPSQERYRSWSTLNGKPGSKWLVFTHFNPTTKRCRNPNIEGLWIVEEDSAFRHRVFADATGMTRWYSYQPFFTEVALRAPTWRMQVSYRGDMIQAAIPNPFPIAQVSEFTPKPLPQKFTFEDATLEFTGLKPVKRSVWNLSGLPGAQPRVKIALSDLRESDFGISHELFDATGNVTDGGLLPFGEPAWGIRLRAVQRKASKLTEWQRKSLVEIPTLGAGDIHPLPVPPFLSSLQVTDMLLLGPGSYIFNGNTVMTRNADGKTSVQGIAGMVSGFTETVREGCLLILCQPGSANESAQREFQEKVQRANEAIFEFQYGNKKLSSHGRGSHTSSGGSMNYNFAVLTRDFALPKNPVGTPESKLRVEYFDPRILEATFYFAPPDVAAFK